MRRPTPIASRIEARRTRLNELADAILARTSDLTDESREWREDCTTLRDKFAGFEATCLRQGSAAGGFATIGTASMLFLFDVMFIFLLVVVVLVSPCH